MKLEKHKKCGRHVLELYPQTEYHCGKIIWDWESTETRCINSPPVPRHCKLRIHRLSAHWGRDPVVGGGVEVPGRVLVGV